MILDTNIDPEAHFRLQIQNPPVPQTVFQFLKIDFLENLRTGERKEITVSDG